MHTKPPSFIGIGASFAGLGLITKLLEAHPQVSATIRAHNFFSSSKFKEKGLAWYEAEFVGSKEGLHNGDCSPNYLVTPGAAKNIATAYPDAKLFVIVRNPIDRAIAQYEYARRSGKIGRNIPCSRYLTVEQSAQTDGFYGQHLHEYFAYYTSLRLHIIVYEDLVEDPLKVIRALYDFLGLNANFVPKQLAAYVVPEEAPKRPSRLYRLRRLVRTVFKRYFEKTPPPVFGPAYQKHLFFTDDELEVVRAACAVDARHLTNLMHRDMGAFWDLESDPVVTTMS